METEEQLIIYTDHALGRMSVRGVTKEMVKEDERFVIISVIWD